MGKFGNHQMVIPDWTLMYVRGLGPHPLLSLPNPQCLPASLLIIILNSLCQAGCWVRMREQMSFQNAGPLSHPLLRNTREAEKEGGKWGKHPYPSIGGGGSGDGDMAHLLNSCSSTPTSSAPVPGGSSVLPTFTPSKGRSHYKPQNSRMSKAD